MIGAERDMLRVELGDHILWRAVRHENMRTRVSLRRDARMAFLQSILIGFEIWRNNGGFHELVCGFHVRGCAGDHPIKAYSSPAVYSSSDRGPRRTQPTSHADYPHSRLFPDRLRNRRPQARLLVARQRDARQNSIVGKKL